MATFRESETETIALIEWHRSCGRTVTRRTEQAMTEADACAAAHALIGDARHVPYAGDDDLKRLRRAALDALMALDQALCAKAFALPSTPTTRALTFALAGIWTDYRWQALSTALVLGFAAAATSKPKTPKPEALYRSEDKS